MAIRPRNEAVIPKGFPRGGGSGHWPRAFWVVGLLALVSGCASVVRNPVPESVHDRVTVLGRDDFRHWGDCAHCTVFQGIRSVEEIERRYGGIMNQEHNYLVISGGGANGAYGAGALKAWSELESRPEFTIVTGVSTGALTAPFAFLGSDYDATLQDVYTTLDTTQLIDTRSAFSLFGADSVVDTTPLSRLIGKVVDEDMIERIAAEHRRGRILAVGTTNMDAGRPVVWNLTRIAALGHPDSAKLIRQVMLASASIPGAFPPVYIEVETPDGLKYDEMHGDGGVSSQMFFYPAGLNWEYVKRTLRIEGEPTLYVIRNAYIHAQYETIAPRLVPIVSRTISSLIRTQGIGDFFRIASLAERDGLDMKITWIPDGAQEAIGIAATEAFDPEYMRALFQFGYRRTLQGDTWQDFSEMMDAVQVGRQSDGRTFFPEELQYIQQ